MKMWQIENSETSEILEISEVLFRVFLFPSFRFCPTAKIGNSDSKIFKKKIPNFLRFSSFPSFQPGWLDQVNIITGTPYSWYKLLWIFSSTQERGNTNKEGEIYCGKNKYKISATYQAH